MKRYLRIWWRMTLAASSNNFSSRFGAFVLIFGKIIRFFFFFIFIYIIAFKTRAIGGYSLSQIIFFFLTYQLIDLIPQFLMREVYRFHGYVVSGDFDYILLRPFSPLFRSLFGGTDGLDIPLLVLSIIFLIPAAIHLGPIAPINVLLYLLFLVNGFVIALAFHIFVLSLGILTTEVDNAIMFYRDLTQMGRVPVDVYKEPLRGFITFVIPVGIMMTIPAKAFMGFLSFNVGIFSLGLGMGFLYLSLEMWNFALRRYGSASS